MAISKRRREKLLIRKEELEKRLEMYKLQEEKILNDSAQTYTIGSRSIQRYQLSLDQIAKMIESLEDEIEGIDDELAGLKRRRAFSAIPTDW